MTITATISLSTSDLRRFADPALRPTPATAPAASVPAPKQSSCDDTDDDAPRRSPVYRALIDALGALVAGASTPSAPAPTPTPAPTPAAAPAATPDASAAAGAATDAAASDSVAAAPAPVLADALQNFAHALMQALRGGDGDGEHRGHHRGWGHHHDNGRHAWGDPAQRIGQLGAQLSAGASSTSAAAAPGTTADTAISNADTGPSAAIPAAAPAPAADAVAPPPASGMVINLTININGPVSTRRHATDDLLEAFGTLQLALGKSAPSGTSLQPQLASFLQALADQLRQGSVQSTDIATQPGALLNVTA